MHKLAKSKTDHSKRIGLVRRGLAMLYDVLIMLAVLLLAGFAALPFSGPNTRAGIDLLYSIYLLLVIFVYFAGCWRGLGMTLGMRAWGLRLETLDGSRPGWVSCLKRFALAGVSTLALGAGFVWSLFEPKGRTWHGMGSGTRLVRVPKNSYRSA